MPEPSPQLDYAPRPPVIARRRVVRWLVGAAILFAIVIGGWVVKTRLLPAYNTWQRRRAAMALWEQCNAFTTPAQEVVYSDKPSYRRSMPAEFVALGPHVGWGGNDRRHQGALLFLHERTNAHSSGSPTERQLVVVQLLRNRGLDDRGNNSWLFYVATILLDHDGDIGIRSYARKVDTPLGLYQPDKRLRLFAGQPDPGDPSRFTIGYDVNGEAGVLEGRILENGDPEFRVLSGPAKRQASAGGE